MMCVLWVINTDFTFRQVDVNFADGDGNTALHYACMQGYRNIAEQLLGAKADITARYGTAMHETVTAC